MVKTLINAKSIIIQDHNFVDMIHKLKILGLNNND